MLAAERLLAAPALVSVATMPRKPPADVIDEFRKTVAGWK